MNDTVQNHSDTSVLYSFIGVLIIFALYVLLMTGYSWLRKRFAKRGGRFGAELTTLSLVVAIGLTINLCVLLKATEEAIGFPALFFRAIYQAIGSFAFEGLAIDPSSNVKPLVTALFYGWPILTGVTFVSIITAKANYEWFSKVRIAVRCLFTRPDVFIFTAINEENLKIAESLNERGNMVIFSGPNLPAFDGKDELCRQVVKNSFYYYSYRDNKDSVKPLIRRLGLHLVSRCCREDSDNPSKRRVVIFSFDSEKQIPKEEENLSFVFDDARKLLTLLPADRKAHLTCNTVEYYILSKREKNYQAYQGKIDALKKEFKYKEDDYAKRYFPVSVTVWGEANAVADIAAKAVHTVVGKDDEWENALCGKEVRVWSLGFGANAQAIVKNLYIHTARLFLNEGGHLYLPNNFRAEVFSPDAETTGAFLSYENPFAIFLYDQNATPQPGGGGGKKSHPSEADQKDKIDDLFLSGAERMLKAAFGKSDTKDWAANFLENGKIKSGILHPEELTVPVINMHKESCVDFDFLDRLDNVTGKGEGKKTDRPQFIVIATGDDYQNIRLTNALVYDIEREALAENASVSKQMLIVNLRDHKNADLFNSKYLGKHEIYAEDGYSTIKINDNLIIAIVGMNTHLYSKDIIEYEKSTNYSYNYDIAQSIGNSEMISSLISQYYANPTLSKPADWEEAIKSIQNAILAKNEDKNARKMILKNWRNMGQWDKESNQSARLFLRVFEKQRSKIEQDPATAIKYMLTEHQRWMRLHFANGWIPGPKDKVKKIHSCLLAYNLVDPFTYIYDLVNSLWDGGKGQEKPEKRCCPFRRNKTK